jgi:hypothetical protein
MLRPSFTLAAQVAVLAILIVAVVTLTGVALAN